MADLNQRLAALTAHRECHTMRDVIVGNTVDVNSDLQAWQNNPLLKVYRRTHNAQQDATAGIQELSSMVLEARRPDAIGRDLVRLFETTHDAVKIRKPAKGKAVKTDRGTLSIQSKGERNEFITITPDDEIEASEEWDLKFLEDAEWNVASSQAASIAADLQELETEQIFKQLKAITNANAAGRVNKADTASLTADHLIDAWGLVKEQNATPDCCTMHPKDLTKLLKDDDFKDSTLLGEFANYSMGMVGMFMGMQMFVSSLHPENEIYVFDKNRVLMMALRRDRLVTPYEMAPHTMGIQISTRYGFAHGDTKSFALIASS